MMPGVAVAKLREIWRDEARRQHLGRAETNGALELGVLTGEVALEGHRFALDPLGAWHEATSGGGQGETAGRAVEEAGAELGFELAEAAPDRGRVHP